MKVEIYRFLFATWPQYRSVTWLCGWGPLILSDHPAKFRVHRPYGTGNNGICNISSNSNSISNSNSNVKVPMPRFTNGHCEQCNQYRFVNMFARLYDVLCFLSLHKLNLFRSYSIILYHDYLNKRIFQKDLQSVLVFKVHKFKSSLPICFLKHPCKQCNSPPPR